MARVAEGLEVLQHQPQVGSERNRNLMVGVQMSFAAVEPLTEFQQNLLDRWVTQFEPAAVRHNVRFPAALNATPGITFEAKEPKSPMVGIVTASRRRPALLVLPPPMFWAVGFAIDEDSAPRRVARPFGCACHHGAEL